MAQAALSGRNTCCLLYGQSGTGKTFTVRGLIQGTCVELHRHPSAKVKLGFQPIYVDPKEQKHKQPSDVNDARNVKTYLDWTDQERHTSKTNLNAGSSRSHTIFTVEVSVGSKTGGMTFVDLAGSERNDNESRATGKQLEEATFIIADSPRPRREVLST